MLLLDQYRTCFRNFLSLLMKVRGKRDANRAQRAGSRSKTKMKERLENGDEVDAGKNCKKREKFWTCASFSLFRVFIEKLYAYK